MGTTTTNLGLYKPANAEIGYDDEVNSSMDTLDTVITRGHNNDGSQKGFAVIGTNTYTATITGLSAYTDKQAFDVVFANASTAASTLNVNSVGEKKIYVEVDGVYTQVASGDIFAGMHASIMYDRSFGNFNALSQTSRGWRGMTAAPNGNVYASVNGGDIYIQTAGAGNFNALSQTSRGWQGMAAAPNGNVYASDYGGDIYMQTNGTGNFNALSQTVRAWVGMTAAPNGNIYACVGGGDIYMQTAGTGNFNALSQTSRVWYRMAAAPNGNVYASDYGGDIYMQTNGTGNFSALSQTSRAWYGMAAAPNGNIYACVENGDIYMQTGGTGNFNALSQTVRVWFGMAAAPNGNVYACVGGGDIYMQTEGWMVRNKRDRVPVEHNTNGTHKVITLDTTSNKVGIGMTPLAKLSLETAGVANEGFRVYNGAVQVCAMIHNDVSTDGLIQLNSGGAPTIQLHTAGNSFINGGNVGIGTPNQFGSGTLVIGIANATTAPTTNPTGGGVLYVEAGALKYRGSSGTVTTIANA